MPRLVSLAAPADAIARRHHLVGYVLQRIDDLPGAVARRAIRRDLDGREIVETRNQIRPGDVLRGHHRLQRHHVVGLAAHVKLVQIQRRQAVLRLGLQDDLPQPARAVELRDVERAEHRLHRAIHFFDRHAERFRLVAIDVDQQLLRRRIEGGRHARQFRPAFRLGNEVVHYTGQLRDGRVALALNPHLGAARRAQARNRGGIDRQDDPFLHLGEILVGVDQHRLRILGFDVGELVALVETFETDEERARVVLVLAVEQAVAVDGRHAAHRSLLHEVIGDLLRHVAGSIEARRVRHDDGAEQVALVFRRQERRWDGTHHHHRQRDHADKQQQCDHEASDHQLDRGRVVVRHLLEVPVEPLEEPFLLMVARLQQQGGQRR